MLPFSEQPPCSHDRHPHNLSKVRLTGKPSGIGMSIPAAERKLGYRSLPKSAAIKAPRAVECSGSADTRSSLASAVRKYLTNPFSMLGPPLSTRGIAWSTFGRRYVEKICSRSAFTRF
jgi:hypothetical protein